MADFQITVDDAAIRKAQEAYIARQQLMAEVTEKYGKTGVKAYNDAEKAAIRAAKGPSEWSLALKANTDAINLQRGAINQQAEALGKASSLLNLLPGELGLVTAGLQKAIGATSALGTAMNTAGASATLFEAAAAPITAVLAAGAFAWSQYNDYVEAGEKALASAREEAERVRKVMHDLAEDQLTAALDAQVLSGALTQVEADSIKAGHAIGEKYGDALGKAVDKMDALKAKLNAIDKEIKSGNAGYAPALLEQQDALNVELDKARAEYDRLNAAINSVTDTTGANIKATADQTAARKEATRATRDQEKAERALDETERMAAARHAADLAENYQKDRKAEQDLIARKVAASAESERIRQQEAAAAEKARAAEREAFKAEYDYQRDLREQAEAETQAMMDSLTNLAGATSDLFDALIDSNIEAAKKGDKAAQDAIMRQFYAQQAAASIEAAINTALAIGKAATVAPPPFNIPSILAATATGVAQEIAIASQSPPSFDDTPGVMTPAGTGQRQTVSLAPDDFWLASKTTNGLLAQMLDHLSRSGGGGGARPGRRPIAGNTLSYNPVQAVGLDLLRITRGGLAWRGFVG